MIKKSIKIIFLTQLALIFLLIPVYAEFDHEFIVETDNQLFPSLIATLQTLPIPNQKSAKDTIGDPIGMVGVGITTNEHIEGMLTVTSSSLIEKSVIKFQLEPSNSKYSIRPIINYNFSLLYGVRQPKPEIITFVLEIEGHRPITKSKKIIVRSINDCPYYFKGENGKERRLNYIYAAYVNENHPIVDEILKKALRTGIVKSFKGYQGSPREVQEEIFAVWNALQREGVKYSSITTASGYSDKVLSQHVRFIQDSYKNAQANCIEGAALLSSVYTKLGLFTELVFPPGHCLLNVYFQNPRRVKKAQYFCIETTAIGLVDLKKMTIERGINHILSGRNNNLSRSNFDFAISSGARQFKKIKTWNKDTKIPIPLVRQAGLLPLLDNRI